MKQGGVIAKHKRRAEPVAHVSADMATERMEGLRQLFPECFTEGKVDFERLRGMLGDEADSRPERYSFSWAGKKDALRLLQAPSRATLAPRSKESLDFEKTGNVFIEGDNLEVLKLLYKPYFGRVKMIYIDPPYNTGGDFVYPDNFADPLDAYLKLTGQKSAEGDLLTSNPETGGRYHSAWLSMMYPRLFLARQLLRDDGVIFVSIDDHEVHNLRMMMNEVFGEESFLACFIWHRRQLADSRNQDRASTDHEYILAYRRPDASLRGEDVDLTKYSNPDNDPRGDWFSADLTGLATKDRRPNLHYDVVDPATGRVYHPSPTRGWGTSKEKFDRLIREGRILWPAKPDGRPRLKKFRRDVTSFQTGFSSMLEAPYTTQGTREIQELFGEKIIQFPKPVALLKALVKQATGQDDLVLDFFAGSCTTGEAVLAQNREDDGRRRFILVQLPEPTQHKGLRTIAEIGKERLRRVIKQMRKAPADKRLFDERKGAEDLGFRAFTLAESNYRPWVGTEGRDPAAYAKQMELYADPMVPGWKAEDVVWEVAIKEGFALDSRVEHLVGPGDAFRVTSRDAERTFCICLDDRVKPGVPEALKLGKEDLFVCRDSALNDETAANLALQCRLKTV